MQPHYCDMGNGPIFQPWPKIARLNRTITITEKIDGTNAAVGIMDDGRIYTQSRTRIITPDDDNFGFARYVMEHEDIFKLLGPGLHFGEWWGKGIQRQYDQPNRTFSLFNVKRWREDDTLSTMRLHGVNIETVPLLYEGPRTMPESGDAPTFWINVLREQGSRAVPGFMKPEGIVIFHTAAKVAFKVTCEKDESYKGETS